MPLNKKKKILFLGFYSLLQRGSRFPAPRFLRLLWHLLVEKVKNSLDTLEKTGVGWRGDDPTHSRI